MNFSPLSKGEFIQSFYEIISTKYQAHSINCEAGATTDDPFITHIGLFDLDKIIKK